MPSPTPTTEVPEYQVVQRSFFEPNILEPGTRILYEGTPGNHLQPLNDAARAKMDEFYEAEFPEMDPKTGQKTGKMIKPRQILRPVAYTPAELSKVTVTALPPEPSLHTDIKSLAELQASRKATDQRPPPTAIPIAIPVPTPAETK